ncbi:MAG TPA: hypothetical protein VGN19_11370, partial [Pedococcus sp.]|nr:hypothetical protein [Pedococcus sp.]
VTELNSTSPEVLEMHAHHAQLNSEADDILAQLEAGPAQSQLEAGVTPLALSAGKADVTPQSPTP